MSINKGLTRQARPRDPAVTNAAESPRTARQRPAATSVPAVALVGNPNTGKTALFNSLTGFRRHVANYPGVTVDVGRGRIRGTSRPVELLDLPGSYSLAACAPDEVILCDALAGRLPRQGRPAAVVAVVDASNPVRNLYLVSQLLELDLPLVVALNMVDVADARGLRIDAARLSDRLGVPVVPVVATRPKTVQPLVGVIEAALGVAPPATRAPLPEALRAEAARLSAQVPGLRPAEVLRALVDCQGAAQQWFVAAGGTPAELEAARQRLRAQGLDAGSAEVRARYAWIHRVLDGLVERTAPPGDTWSARLDRLLTHRVAGAAILLVVLYGLFCAIYAGAQPLMDLVDGLFGWLGRGAAAVLPAGVVQSLVVDGLIAGVGAVLVFLPQILILYLCIALLEDCGYLSRAAFMVDRVMRPLGLSGRALIPLLSSFACAVPAIMGTRTIGDRRERLITILLTPFMTCSARLPIYVLLIGALVPARSWLGGWVRLDALVLLGLYLLGIVVALPVAWVLQRTVLAGPPGTFLLELPSYKRPRLRTVCQRVHLAGRGFVVRAGTIILLVNLVVWALGYFPRRPETRQAVEQQRAARGWDAATFEGHLAAAYVRDSYLGRLGRAIEPAIRPLGWDWRIGVGVLASFPAREVIIAVLGTVSNLGAGADDPESLRAAIRELTWPETGAPLFTLPVALSIMVFFALCAQCASTLVVMGRETGSWAWPAASFTGMTLLAYGLAWLTCAGARAAGW